MNCIDERPNIYCARDVQSLRHSIYRHVLREVKVICSFGTMPGEGSGKGQGIQQRYEAAGAIYRLTGRSCCSQQRIHSRDAASIVAQIAE